MSYCIKIPEICECNDFNILIDEFDKVYSQLDEVYSKMISNFKNIIVNVFKSDPKISTINFETIKSWARKIGNKDPFSAKINDLSDEKWLEQIISYAAAKPANEWNDADYNEAILKLKKWLDTLCHIAYILLKKTLDMYYDILFLIDSLKDHLNFTNLKIIKIILWKKYHKKY